MRTATPVYRRSIEQLPSLAACALITVTVSNSEAVKPQASAHAMVRRRAETAGVKTKIGNHTFRATGITAYLKNGGMLDSFPAAQQQHFLRKRLIP
jgi:integrase